jgi:hypothetical protein
MKKFVLAAALGLSATAVFAEGATETETAAAEPDMELVFTDADKEETFEGKDRTGLGLRATASTLGVGGEVTWRINDRFGVRAPFGSADGDFEGEYEGYDITGSAKMGGVGLLVDYFPMGGAFHISGGAFKTDYAANGTAHDVDFNGYKTDIHMDFTQKEDFAPVAAMGWDWQIGKHGTITADLGAIFGSGFDLDARESSGSVPQSSVDAETADIREAASKVKVIPYLKFGAGFKF